MYLTYPFIKVSALQCFWYNDAEHLICICLWFFTDLKHDYYRAPGSSLPLVLLTQSEDFSLDTCPTSPGLTPS